MAQRNTYQDINPYTLHDRKLVADIRRKLAKRANQRIVRLERATSKVTGESYSKIGIINETRGYIERTYGKTKKRFSESINYAKNDIDRLRLEILALQRFLNAQSSTVQGIRQTEEKRIKAFAEGRYGPRYHLYGTLAKPIKFASVKEFYDFLGSDTFRNLISAGFTSEQIIDIYDQSADRAHNAEEATERMEEAVEQFRAKSRISLKELIRITGAKKLT